MTPAFSYTQQSRNRPTLIAVLAVWLALGLAWVFVDASGWVIGIIGVFTLPAVYDLWANPRAELHLTDQSLRWTLPRSDVEIALHEIDQVRLDTRLDFSVRATVILKTGPKLRIPVPATPPHRNFETALQERGITTQRHHFNLIQ